MGNNPSQLYYGAQNGYDYTPGPYDNYDYMYNSSGRFGRGPFGNRLGYQYQYMPQPSSPMYSGYDYKYYPWSSSYYPSTHVYAPQYSPYHSNHYSRSMPIYYR